MNKTLQTLAVISIAIVGVVTIVPIVAAFDPEKVAALYGITLQDEVTVPLMRHRQVLLGLLGAALLYAAFAAKFRLPVIAAALISKLAFIFFAFRSPSATHEVLRVAYVDAAAILFLAFSAFVFWRSHRR